MLTRTITIAAAPPITITLFYHSRSNSEKEPMQIEGAYIFTDDFKQRAAISSNAQILSDVTQDGLEMYRAQGEMQIVKMLAEMKFDERIDADQMLKTLVNKKKAAAMAQQMRQQVPTGFNPNPQG